MHAYNTRSGARLAQRTGLPGTADPGAGSDLNGEGSADGVSTTPTVNTGTMEMPRSIKDPSIILLRAEYKAANIAVDNIAAEIDKQAADVE